MASKKYIVDNPVGVDAPIQDIQNFFFDKLSWTEFDIYGRVYKLRSEKGNLPKAFISGKDYRDVFTNDRRTASIFFICDNKSATKQGVMFSVKTKMVFMINLNKIFSDTSKRYDSDAQRDAVELINKKRSFNFNGEIETEIEEIFKGFNTDGIKTTDLGKFHVFSLNGEINYTFSGDGCTK